MQTARSPETYPRPSKNERSGDSRPRQFVSFTFFKIDPAWFRLPKEERDKGLAEWLSVYHEYRERFLIYPYTLFGIRADADFMLWRISYRIEDFVEMSAALSGTGFGAYLTTTRSFLSMTKRSVYIDQHAHEGQDGARMAIRVTDAKYLVVYPFEKTREWYLLTPQVRQNMMNDHIAVGHRYPTVKLNTTYSFGLDDQEFVVAFETDHLDDFLDLVQELRESAVSRYTKRDTPIFTCIACDVDRTLKGLGG